jgi:hypothetical protein
MQRVVSGLPPSSGVTFYVNLMRQFGHIRL